MNRPSFLVLGLVVLVLFSPTPVTADKPNDPRLREILANIEANEKLFRNCEAKWVQEYNLHGEHLPGLDPTKWSFSSFLSIRQGNYLRLRYSREYKTLAGKAGRYGGALAFDGKLSRYYFQSDREAFVRPGLHQDERFVVFHPIAFLFGSGPANQHFSRWLWGDPDVLPTDKLDGLPSDIVELSYVGEEVLEGGLTCIKLTRTIRSRREPDTVIKVDHLWISPKHNYALAKFENFYHQFSKDKIFTEGFVKEWMQYDKEIWLPRIAVVTGYNDFLLQTQGKHERLVTEELRLQFFALDPQYEKEFFTELPFPEDRIVYEVDDSGHIIKAHKPGTYIARTSVFDAVLAGEYNWLLYGVVVLIVAVAVGTVVLFWRRKLTPRRA